MGIGGGVLL